MCIRDRPRCALLRDAVADNNFFLEGVRPKFGKSADLLDKRVNRNEVDIPGRALSTIRVVLTGERTGPNLAVLTTLLGEADTRNRLEKARKYRSR